MPLNWNSQLTDSSHLLAVLDRDFTLTVTISPVVLGFLIGGIVLGVLWIVLHRTGSPFKRLRSFEIDQASLGLGSSTLVLRPNETDRQIAYQIWVELSTRKIGIPIDLDHDVVAEIYDSWYSFFSITRDLIKSVPVQRVRRRDTAKIVQLSVDILNQGLRPHLTRWQARFRHWYRSELENASGTTAPQDIQKRFPEYSRLSADLLKLNARLISYRQSMHDLAIERESENPVSMS